MSWWNTEYEIGLCEKEAKIGGWKYRIPGKRVFWSLGASINLVPPPPNIPFPPPTVSCNRGHFYCVFVAELNKPSWKRLQTSSVIFDSSFTDCESILSQHKHGVVPKETPSAFIQTNPRISNVQQWNEKTKLCSTTATCGHPCPTFALTHPPQPAVHNRRPLS